MIKRQRKILILLMMSLTLMLVACDNNDKPFSKEMLQSMADAYPEALKDGTISKDFNKALSTCFFESERKSAEPMGILLDLIDNPKSMSEVIDEREFSRLMTNYTNVLWDNCKFSPETPVDREISDLAAEVIERQIAINQMFAMMIYSPTELDYVLAEKQIGEMREFEAELIALRLEYDIPQMDVAQFEEK